VRRERRVALRCREFWIVNQRRSGRSRQKDAGKMSQFI
jgi:hypothetical protein